MRAVVVRMFDGMRAGDTAAIRATLHPDARLQSVDVHEGRPAVRTIPMDAFLRAVGTPHAEMYDERIANVEVRVDGDLATAWMDYAFYVGPKFSHCGIDAFQLFRGPDGWRVLQIADTRHTSCPRMNTPPPAA
ncbi:MAG TPA: nuclear transport factor 2 family protein [Longimicrobiaceae bacterium]|nr:nuclear transport factor 2 family protein [Longimicrobiaceae bacterium]